MEQALQIAQYVVCVLAVVFSVAQFIYNKIKGSKSKFLTNFMGLLNEISTSLGFAEQMTKLKGEQKKEFAQKTIATYCENKNIKISEEQLNLAIETLISLSKKVNAREKDLEADDGLVGDCEADNAQFANSESVLENGELI